MFEERLVTFKEIQIPGDGKKNTLVNVYVDLVVFTRIDGTS